MCWRVGGKTPRSPRPLKTLGGRICPPHTVLYDIVSHFASSHVCSCVNVSYHIASYITVPYHNVAHDVMNTSMSTLMLSYHILYHMNNCSHSGAEVVEYN